MFSNILINDREYYTLGELRRFIGWFIEHWGNSRYNIPKFMSVTREFREYAKNTCISRVKINDKIYLDFDGLFRYLDNTLSKYIRYDRLMKHNKNHREFIYECFSAYCSNRENEEYYNSIGRYYSF